MISFNLYTGKVISTDDEDKLGRIQIKILPEMKDVSDNDCPWIEPFFGNSSEDEIIQDFPPIGTWVWCLCDKNFYDKYYLHRRNIKGTYDFDIIKDLLDKLSDADSSDSDYQYLKFYLYEDQSLMFHNTNNGEHGFLHKDETYTLFDKDGNYFIYGKDKDITFYNDKTKILAESNGDTSIENDNSSIKILNNGNIEINGNADYVTAFDDMKSAFDTLKGDMNTFIGIYNAHNHPTAPPGAVSPPSATGSPSSADMSGAKVSNVKVP